MDLHGQRVVVLGGTSGIGLATYLFCMAQPFATGSIVTDGGTVLA